MAYVAPSTVTTLQTYTSSAHNIIVNDIIDHESRIANSEAAWTSWTPSSRGGITVGNGTETAKYTKTGKTCSIFYRFVLGTTSAITGDILIALPFTQSAVAVYGIGDITDNGIADYMSVIIASGSYAYVRVMNASGTYATPTVCSATVPMTWGNLDNFTFSLTYETS